MAFFFGIGKKCVAGNDRSSRRTRLAAEIEHIDAVIELCPDEKPALGSVICKKIAEFFINTAAEQIKLSAVNLSDFVDVTLKIAFGQLFINDELRNERGVNILSLLGNGQLCDNLGGSKNEADSYAGSDDF